MSDKDLQFIERALAHPWMFWVYFWKWPRIVRQACAEYDLLAKERDAARTAHAEAAKANKKVWEWIHVTHRLSTTPEAIRAIFAAGKRLSIFLVFFVVTNAFGQAPPYLRNQWTTNANPLALKVISTNGVHAATNVWELDFTNTATVTVSAVSNANKVMVSFTGAASGGGDTVWTNDGTFIRPIGSATVTIETNNGTISSILNTDSFIQLTNASVAGGTFINSPGSYTYSENASQAGGYFNTATNCFTEAYKGSHAGGRFFAGAKDSWTIAQDGAHSGGYFQTTTNCRTTTSEGGIGNCDMVRSTNCSVTMASGSQGGGFFVDSTGCSIGGTGGSRPGGNFDISIACRASGQLGSTAGGSFASSTNANVTAANGAFGLGTFIIATNAFIRSDLSGFAVGYIKNSRDVLITNTQAALAVGSVLTATNVSIIATNGSFALGIAAADNERIYSGGTAVGAMAVGRNVTSTNNWTFGIHYTNTVPLSLAVGANGTTQFRAASNSVVIRTETAPTVGQILTATDTSGTVGWSNAPAASGGGIASIFTNNVLAGGPGLTELEFTNSATVLVASTTNAGRVTVSFESTVGAPGIATNNGTGWDTTFRSVSTNTVPLRIESEAGLNLTNFFQAATNGGVPFFVINSNKFIGIGTNSPLAPLHIVPTVQEADSLRLDHTNGTPRIRFGTYPSAPTFGGLWLGDVTRNGNNIALACDNTGFLILNGPSTVNFQTAGAARWTINSSGHFVAGTDNTYDIGEPGAKRPRNTYVANVNTSSSSATTATNRVAITATGYTNTLTVGSVAVNVDVYFDAATAALQDSAGNALHTFQAGTNITAHLKPNWRLVGTTMAGTAIAH